MENKLPIRKSPRLKNYDYNQNGYYFITICTYKKINYFGDIRNGIIESNEFGDIVSKHITLLNTLYEGIAVDKYIIMPNHLHLIIAVACRGRISCLPQTDELDRTKMKIAKMMQQLKSCITKECNKMVNSGKHKMCSLQWQKSYHDHIIRNQHEYLTIWQYIDTNQLKWAEDCYYE